MLTAIGTACATYGPRPVRVGSSQGAVDLSAYRTVVIEVTSASGLGLSNNEHSRIRDHIDWELRVRHPRLFSTEARLDGALILRMRVHITRYEEGSPFLRLLLAGLGGMQIAADVSLAGDSSDVPLARYRVEKDFAWGGLYGASITMEGVELGFARSVAQTIAK